MSSPRTRIISLNLGSQSIELAEFRAEPHGGLILCGYRSRELFVDPATDGMRRTQIVTALREMLGELQIKSGNVNYTVAEESVFSRFVKLPAIDEEKIERIISFEAQQNVPFPIDEVVWDYQLVGGGLGEQIQVALVAIKADLLDQINGAVEETGLRTSIVDLATMALYNAFRYNYSGLSGCSLLIDIGARTTNLLFIEPGRIFTRSVPIGGISVTSAIAKEFNEPFAAAEFRKKRDGSAGPTGAGAETLEGDVARVSKIVRNTLTRLHAELMRSISHYCAQQMGSPPERIFLSGGGANKPSIRELTPRSCAGTLAPPASGWRRFTIYRRAACASAAFSFFRLASTGRIVEFDVGDTRNTNIKDGFCLDRSAGSWCNRRVFSGSTPCPLKRPRRRKKQPRRCLWMTGTVLAQ